MAEPDSAVPINPQEATPANKLGPVLVSSSSTPIDRVQEQFTSTRDRFSNAVSRLHRQMSDLANDRPLQVVVAVAIISLLAGVALRVWRSNSYD